jgi:hypothetical protein
MVDPRVDFKDRLRPPAKNPRSWQIPERCGDFKAARRKSQAISPSLNAPDAQLREFFHFSFVEERL